MDRITEVAQNLESEEAATLVGKDRAGTAAEAELRKGVVVKTTTPSTKTNRDCGAAVRTVRTEVGCHTERID